MKRNARKLLALIMSLVMSVSLCLFIAGCQDKREEKVENSSVTDEKVEKALELITDRWEEVYQDFPQMGKEIRVVYTQVYYIEPDSRNMEGIYKEAYDEYLSDIDAIVSFTILSDYYSSGDGYLSDASSYDEVVFYRDGSAEVQSNVLMDIGRRFYDFKFSEYIKECVDFGDDYNCTIRLDQ